MKHGIERYQLSLIIILLISLGIILLFKNNVYMTGIFSVPAVSTLLVFIYQVLRDRFLFEQKKMLQLKKQQFDISIASQIAYSTFQKHSEFCEKYIGRLTMGLNELIEISPFGDDVIKCINEILKDLNRIKNEYATWIPYEIGKSLNPFENDLRTIAESNLLLKGSKDDLEKKLNKSVILDNYRSLFGFKKDNNHNRISAAYEVIEFLRDLLGINQITSLRQKMIEVAIKEFEK